MRVGRDASGILYVEAELQRRDASQIVADGVEHVRQFRSDGFVLEINQFQELFRAEFRRVGQQQHVDLPLGGINNSIRRLGPYLSQRRLRFKARSPGTLLLVQQLRDFPVGDHDDGPDSLEMALRLMTDLWNGRNRGPLPTYVIPG